MCLFTASLCPPPPNLTFKSDQLRSTRVEWDHHQLGQWTDYHAAYR